MDHPFTRIYALAVCFVSIVCITITTGMGLYSVVQIVVPSLSVSPYQQTFYQGRHAAIPQFPQGANIKMEAGGYLPDEAPTKEELELERKAQYKQLLENESQEGTRSLIRLFIVLIVTTPLFFFHWRLANYTRQSTGEDS